MRELSRRRFLALGGSAIGGAMLGTVLGGTREARALAPRPLPTYHVRANKTLVLERYAGGYYVDLNKYRLWLGRNARVIGPPGEPWAAPLVQVGTFIDGRTLINREPDSGGGAYISDVAVRGMGFAGLDNSLNSTCFGFSGGSSTTPYRELRIERTEVENFPGVAYRLHNCDYELIDVRATNLMRGGIITRYNCLGYIKNPSIIDSGDDAWAHMANEPDAPETSIHEGRGCTIEGGVFQRRYPTELGSNGTPRGGAAMRISGSYGIKQVGTTRLIGGAPKPEGASLIIRSNGPDLRQWLTNRVFAPHACRFEYVNVNSPEIHGIRVRDDGHDNDPPYDIYGSATVTVGEGLKDVWIEEGIDVGFQLVPVPSPSGA
jgi:hypothetical protein